MSILHMALSGMPCCTGTGPRTAMSESRRTSQCAGTSRPPESVMSMRPATSSSNFQGSAGASPLSARRSAKASSMLATSRLSDKSEGCRGRGPIGRQRALQTPLSKCLLSDLVGLARLLLDRRLDKSCLANSAATSATSLASGLFQAAAISEMCSWKPPHMPTSSMGTTTAMPSRRTPTIFVGSQTRTKARPRVSKSWSSCWIPLATNLRGVCTLPADPCTGVACASISSKEPRLACRRPPGDMGSVGVSAPAPSLLWLQRVTEAKALAKDSRWSCGSSAGSSRNSSGVLQQLAQA
mmetsp:Transcript_68044/g.221519  ORF Transcript_68044/g.221519 Transcript_68044/m.221519 type:complete len:296 (-) Transcript_68044:2316-3203(-)